ncbi:hypothetical protein RUND412_011596 [Rhizina undulata]
MTARKDRRTKTRGTNGSMGTKAPGTCTPDSLDKDPDPTKTGTPEFTVQRTRTSDPNKYKTQT